MRKIIVSASWCTWCEEVSIRWNVTSEKSSFAAFNWTNDVLSLVRNDRTVDYFIFPFGRNLKNQNGFEICDAGSVDEFISEQENKSTAKKTLRDVKLLQLFLVTKNEERNIEDIPTGELNEHTGESSLFEAYSIYLQVLSMT